MPNQKRKFLAGAIIIYVALLLAIGAIISYIYQTDLLTFYFSLKDIQRPSSSDLISLPSISGIRAIVWIISILSFPLIIIAGFEMIDKAKEV